MRRRRSAVQRYMERHSRQELPAADAEVLPAYGLPRMHSLLPAAEGDGETPLPDLLHPTPSARIDFRAAQRALEFAFTAGDAGGVTRDALAAAALAPSSWEPSAFAEELFVDSLIDGVMAFDVEGRRARLDRTYLKRLLTHPPQDEGIAHFRQQVLEELCEQPALEAALRESYARVAEVQRLLDEADSEGRFGMPRWRLEMLSALRAFFDSLDARPFANARSGLSRLFAYGAQVRASQGYEALRNLLDFEGDMARVDLRVRLGADGKLRELTPLARRENAGGPFYRGPVYRWLWRVLNALRGYQLGEATLVERWFDHVFAGILPFLPAMVQLRGDLEFYLASLELRDRARQRGLATCLPELWTDPDPEAEQAERKELEAVFNPLLLMQPGSPVPCDLSLDTFRRTCILTGPNSGGKTRLLQALALTQMLGQAGSLVPAARARLRPASGMFVSLGHPTSAGDKEGRLGTELLRIRGLFETARRGCLIVLDELCSGTNPSEGEEIFHLVVDLLRELRPEVYITTHFLQFAAQLSQEAEARKLCFLQVELDAGQVPTYRFVPGVATTSLAHRTAARLGVTRDELLSLIRRQRG